MNYRTQPPLALPRSPLIFVLAQVRISPVLTMEDKIPAIQEALRKQGFPRFQTRTIEETKMLGNAPVEIQKRKQWEFIDRETTTSVLVDQESIVLQTTRYPSFEFYLERLAVALRVVNDAAEPAEMLRLGLRYVDLVIPEGNRTLAYYIKPELLGSSFEAIGKRKAFMCESLLNTGEHSKLVVRYVEGTGGFAFPPDLLPMTLAFRRNPVMKSTFGMLDFDHFMEKPTDFSLEVIMEQSWKLHGVLEAVFKTSVTSDGLSEWGQA